MKSRQGRMDSSRSITMLHCMIGSTFVAQNCPETQSLKMDSAALIVTRRRRR
jgi:hypothetical protein